jgi:hypothetical protein
VPWTLAWAAIFVGLVGAHEIAFRIARGALSSLDDAGRSQLATLQASILGMVALLLGFTFGMAASRYDLRKQVFLDEANAVGTAYLRSKLLPEPEREEAGALFRGYVDARLEFYGSNAEQSQTAEQRGKRIQQSLWTHALEASTNSASPVSVGLFVLALNNVIDLDEKVIVALENHVPNTILIVLGFGTLSGAVATGCGSGVCRRRMAPGTLVLPFLLASVIAIIVDLDRPQHGFIRVGQQSMLRLRESLGDDDL